MMMLVPLAVVTTASGHDFLINVDWTNVTSSKISTAATVEVDLMPHLGRTAEGGSFAGYFNALSNLGAHMVRFSPWFGYPRVDVAELQEADCSTGGRGSSWNSSLLDAVVADFMLAVCGPDAARGHCESGLSVVPQLSTMPDWMYEPDGHNRTALMPADPWQYPPGKFDYYLVKGRPLIDPSCRQMARYAARYIGWYTAGGFVDECGVRHNSGLHYDWPLLSVLNEDEYHTPPGDGVQYTICWDAWRDEIQKVNPKISLVGPETAGGPDGLSAAFHGHRSRGARTANLGGQLSYSLYFLNASNHADGRPPPFISNHVALYGPPYHQFFDGVDDWVHHVAEPLEQARAGSAPETQLVMNEFIPFNNDWCNTSHGANCAWDFNSSSLTGINRKSVGWSAAAASFAYAFGRLSELGFAWVGADQLIGGTWPDNEPAVASLDWRSGEPNAKYWAVRMLARRFSNATRDLLSTKVTGGPPPPKPGQTAPGNCGITSYRDDCNSAPSGAFNTTTSGMKALGDCVNKCHACAACNFVSFSLQNEDCSWYDRCDMAHLTQTGAHYTSEAVKSVAADPNAYLYGIGVREYGTVQSETERGVRPPGRKTVLLVSKVNQSLAVQVDGAANAQAEVLEARGDEPGFAPPSMRCADSAGRLTIGPFAVALIDVN